MAEIRWTVRQVAESRGITTPQQLAEAADIALNTAKSHWHGFAERIDRATLLKLCIALKAAPGDLMTFEENHSAELLAA